MVKCLRIVFFITMIAAVTTFSAGSKTAAQAPPSDDSMRAAKELVSVVSPGMVSDLVATLTAQLWPKMEAALLLRNFDIDPATLAELRKEFERIVVTDISETMNGLPAIYARYFTTQEMRDLTAFYRTPTGTKSLKVLPQATFEIIAPRVQGLQGELSLAFQAVLQRKGILDK
jgi:uncharacterized protein